MIKINNNYFNNPTLCISIIDNYLVFTTKKNGSRYFEDLSVDVNASQRINTTNCNLLDYYENNIYHIDVDSTNLFIDSVWWSNQESPIDINIFFELIGINSFGELFSKKTQDKFEFIFIIRNPIDRFFTGFFEKVDSIILEIQSDKHNIFTFEILKKYFDIYEYNSLKKLNQNTINLILNEYANSIDSRIFNDEHLSFWNHFLLQFLQKTNLENKVKIIDLNDYSKMNIFNKIQQPSNKRWLSNWLNAIENKPSVDLLLLKFKSYFDVEMNAYNILLNKSNG